MNWEQLKAILWLRWRLSVNQWRKAGAVNFVLMVILVAVSLIFAAVAFLLALGLGIALLPKASPTAVLITWDILIGVLLLSWMVSLLIEIQRMEMLSLEKLLHLPMSLRDAFLLNYLSSLINLSILCFFPTAIGLSVAMAITHGPRMLILLPLVLSFILMLTAVTYQFRGWLALLMVNKRRQRTVVTVLTLIFVGIVQVPNIIVQLSLPGANKAVLQQVQHENEQRQALLDAMARQEISNDEYNQQLIELNASIERATAEQAVAKQNRFDNYLTIGNQLLPVGWLPYASKSLLIGSIWPAGLCLGAMTSIGTASLWRAYTSTIRHYTGRVNKSAHRSLPQRDASPESAPPLKRNSRRLIERRLPGVSEHTSAIAVGNMQNLVRAPEAKMVLIGPFVLGLMFVLMVITNRLPPIPFGAEPLVWLAGATVLTFTSMMLMLNIFGMDRNGFRCYVLMPVPRSVILIGKNISLMPAILTIAIILTLGMVYVAPIGVMHFLAIGSQMLVTTLLTCLVGNWVSIYFPFTMSPGSGKPVQIKLLTVLIQMVAIVLAPIFIVPGFAFFGLEWLVVHYAGIGSAPIFVLLSLLEAWGAIALYRYVVERQGQLLQARESQILEVVTASTE